MLAVGDKVPDFTLPVAYADGRRDPVPFSSFLGKGPVVLSFFPLAFTRVCTTQMCDLRDHDAELAALGATALGFSCDSHPVNVEFAKAKEMRHGIVSDPNREVVERIWAMDSVLGIKTVPKRGWMVVDARGVVVDQWVAPSSGAPWPGNAPIVAAVRRAMAVPA